MEKSTNSLIKDVVELKKENERLEELINFLQRENFDYALKCNHMENVLENINSITKNSPGQLLETLDDICNILQVGGQQKKKPVAQNEKTLTPKVVQKSEKTAKGNKAHIVKPHMVNGHILYVPTINLTRVSNLNTQANKSEENNAMANLSNEETSNVSQLSILNEENDNELDNAGESSGVFRSENQLTQIDEVSEPSTSSSSKSPSHSTVLSGTFQEVKIYLNQMSSDSIQDEPTSSKRKTLRSPIKKSKSSGKSKSKSRRSTVSFDGVTMRKRS